MDMYINIKPFERLQEIFVKDVNNGEDNIHHFVFLEDVPETILHDYREYRTSINEPCNITMLGVPAFNQKFKEETKKQFIKEYGNANNIIIK